MKQPGGVAQVGNAGFPLGKTGGLIEAGAMLATISGTTCFRWVKPAASLKHRGLFGHGCVIFVSAG